MEAPGEKLLIKMWETLAEKGIGALLAPWQMRRVAKASAEIRREELLVIAQAEKEADMIRRGEASLLSDSGKLIVRDNNSSIADSSKDITLFYVENLPSRSPTANLVSDQLVADTLRREANIARALLHAEDALRGDTQEPPEEKVDQDWLFRWRDSASQVSDAELQSLWGSLLAGEIKSPGSYSLRTVEFLKNLSKIEAEEISKLAPFVIDDFVHRDQTILERFELTYSFLLQMQDLGILSGVTSTGLTIEVPSAVENSYLRGLRCGSKLLVLKASNPHPKKIPVFKVTAIGQQVLKLGSFDPNVEYLRAVGERLKGGNFEVLLADWAPNDAGSLTYFNAVPL